MAIKIDPTFIPDRVTSSIHDWTWWKDWHRNMWRKKKKLPEEKKTSNNE